MVIFLRLIIIFLTGFIQKSYAFHYQARIYTGGFASREEFKEASDGAHRNDLARLSERFYLSSSHLLSKNISFAGDLRDRYDFFDKVDKTNLELKSGNKLQLRQLSTQYESPHKFFKGDLGRFPVAETGNSAYTDGLNIKFQVTRSFSSGTFGGLNPKRPDQTYLQFNKNSKTTGFYLDYIPPYTSWEKNLSFTNAFYIQQFDSQTDRSVWYQNLIYQWNESNRFYSTYNLDFTPKTNLQFLNTSYWKKINSLWSLTPSILSIDNIEYNRRKSVRERLPSSPYREGDLDNKFKLNSSYTFQVSGLYGKRQFDHKTKYELKAGSIFSNFISKRFSAYFKLGYRADFVNEDYFTQFGFGYFQKSLELNLDEELALENRPGVRKDLPSITDASMSYFISNSIYGSFSLQYAKDRLANIFSCFLKIGFRFGNEPIPALRDGAPPLGRI